MTIDHEARRAALAARARLDSDMQLVAALRLALRMEAYQSSIVGLEAGAERWHDVVVAVSTVQRERAEMAAQVAAGETS